MRENIFWDKKITKDEAREILRDEKNPKFIYIASIVFSRTNNAKEVFSDYLDKVVFCRNWRKIKGRMRKDRWSDNRIVFWDEVYRVVVKGIDPKELKKSPKKQKPINSNIKHIGDSLKEARKKKGWTQKELASYAELSQQTISSIEKGYLNFSLQTFLRTTATLSLDIIIQPKN